MTKEEYRIKSEKSASRKDLALSLRTMAETDGWKICLLIITAEKEALELTVKDLSVKGEALQEARLKLHYIDRLLGMPEALALSLENPKQKEFSIYKSQNRIYD